MMYTLEHFENILDGWNIDHDMHTLKLFEKYHDLLTEWNKKMNLTSITSKEDIYLKHFADSLALFRNTDLSGKSVIDVGSGAGFPGIPLAIMCRDCNMVLLDSLHKRTFFLEEVKKVLGLSNVTVIHGRAEDLARDIKYREKFDVAVSRAVAALSVLSEYCLPFVDVGGMFISYKGGNVSEETMEAGVAISVLGGIFDEIDGYFIPDTEYERTLVYIKKVKNTPEAYPRRAGKPTKKPL